MRVSIPRQEITAFCGRWGIAELAIFGSALRDDFRPDSDVDVLVSFLEHARPTLFDMVRMRGELEGIFGRRVDLVSRRGIESSRNQIRKRAILDSAEVVHAA
jgi:predicted nucleotidyltransferase